MKVAIRTDSSRMIGSGHLMRCLTLADLLEKAGCEVQFVCRDLPGSLHRLVIARDFKMQLLPALSSYGDSLANADDYKAWLGCSQEEDGEQTAAALSSEGSLDWIIVDHYGLDRTWQQLARGSSARIMVIDDLANRQHQCDLLLDQNYYTNLTDRYKTLVPSSCRSLLGPEYALLRAEFYKARATLAVREGDIRRVLIFFGGYDQTNETTKTLEGLAKLSGPKIDCTVVVGSNNPHADLLLRRYEGSERVRILTQVDNMAELIANSDLGIGGGGTTTWERCFLGLPTLTIEIADNQRIMLNDIAAYGAVWNLGPHEAVTSELITERLEDLRKDAAEVKKVSERCFSLMGRAALAGQHGVVREVVS